MLKAYLLGLDRGPAEILF